MLIPAALFLFFSVLIGFAWRVASRDSDVNPIVAATVLVQQQLSSSNNHNRSVLFVFAHPDDEAMFFTPTLYGLQKVKDSRANGSNVSYHFLCLTSGNFDGLARVREKELEESAKFYGAASCTVVDDEKCLDGPKAAWNLEFVAHEIIAKKIEEIGTVKTIITFDEMGVSGHKNHGDTFRAVQLAIAKMRRVATDNYRAKEVLAAMANINNDNISGPIIPVCYKLRSFSLIRKYMSVIGALLACGSREEKHRKMQREGSVVSIFVPPSAGLLSMQGLWRHRSQFVWFRFFYVLFASYSYENVLERFA